MTRNSQRQRGFSILEVAIVSSIVMVLAVIATPNMINVVSNARLRGAATSLSGLLQNSRATAAKLNRTETVRFVSVSMGPYAYVKDANSTSTTLETTDPQVQLGAPIIQMTTPNGGVSELDSTTLGFTALTYPELPSFNPWGMPCKYSGGNCVSNGYVFYFTDTRRNNGWTAVSISPAGRVKQWFWYGTAWGS